MSSHNLPPLRHLPQWTRVGRLGKPCCSPRRLPAPENQLQPLPVAPPPADRGGVWRAAAEVSSSSRHSNNIMDHRVASMERNIQFLQLQHKDTLEKLHAEIDYLRRENKELQYKLIMEPPKSSRKGMSRSRRGVRPPTQGSDAHTGLYLEEPLQDTRPAQDQALSAGEGSEMLGSARQERGPEVKGGLITSLQPLRIHSNPSHPPRAPTLQECEVIIRQLYNANSLQSQEIIRVKALLRDIVLSKKITPENYILTKAYLVDGTRKSTEEKKFPKLGIQTFPEKNVRKSCLSLYLITDCSNLHRIKGCGPSQSGVVLPALKQSLSSTIAERQRRTRAVQRDRFKRTVQ